MEDQDHHEHESYGEDIPDEGEMEADVEMTGADEDPKSNEDMKKRWKEIEDEAGALREMQAKVEKEMGAVQGRVTLSLSLVYLNGFFIFRVLLLGFVAEWRVWEN
eukprot:TRINITY_DN38772_c0_g1_i2.p3 TRINITY_DN38772_c0_g1~~TRINITY_DN38772_c0_g1_i2.p3  ORF type:complete len:105 (-),score=28.86 TRINITY_DN38772_c0_g1_i2:1074-1388(-)